MAGLQKLVPEIAARGATLYVIGLGAISFIAGLRDTTGYQGPVLIDPDRKAYQAAAFKRPLLGILDPRTLFSGMAALKAGYAQSAPQGDAAQLGGVFVITPQDRLLLRHIEQFAGDTVREDRLLGVLK